MIRRFRLFVAAAAALSLVAATPAGAQSRWSRTPSAAAQTPPSDANCPSDGYRRDCRPRRPDRDGGVDPLVAAGAGVAVVALFATLFGSGGKARGDRAPDEADLLRDGPQLPTAYPVGSFSVRGFAKDGWPIVLDFRPEPRTRTTLDVVFGKKKVASMVVDTNGLEGRHLVKQDTPRFGWAKKARPATYVLRSEYIDASGASAGPAPIQVYGIGGGPRAVGSVAIERLRFLPGVLRPGTLARFDYAAKSPFDHTHAEVLKFEADGSAIRLARVMEERADDVRVGLHSGQWDGSDQRSRAPSLGAHRFQVRAWFTTDDKSWVGAIAPDLVQVR